MTHWVMLENTHCLRDEITLEVLSYRCKFRGRPVSEELRRELANWEVFEAILLSGERDTRNGVSVVLVMIRFTG